MPNPQRGKKEFLSIVNTQLQISALSFELRRNCETWSVTRIVKYQGNLDFMMNYCKVTLFFGTLPYVWTNTFQEFRKESQKVAKDEQFRHRKAALTENPHLLQFEELFLPPRKFWGLVGTSRWVSKWRFYLNRRFTSSALISSRIKVMSFAAISFSDSRNSVIFTWVDDKATMSLFRNYQVVNEQVRI